MGKLRHREVKSLVQSLVSGGDEIEPRQSGSGVQDLNHYPHYFFFFNLSALDFSSSMRF